MQDSGISSKVLMVILKLAQIIEVILYYKASSLDFLPRWTGK